MLYTPPSLKKIIATFSLAALMITSHHVSAQEQKSSLSFKLAGLSQQALTSPLSIAKQGSFFVGGRDIQSDTLSTLPAYAASGTITVDQMYTRYQVPVKAKEVSLVLIHGCCQTGMSWETTPDGRMGWDEYFVRRGYPTYVIDQSGRGRSAVNATVSNAVKMGKEQNDKLPTVFAASHESAWTIFRFGPEFPKVYDGMKFPVGAQNGLWQQMVPDWLNTLPTPNPTVPALSTLAKQLKKTILMSHSQSGIYPFQTAAMDTAGIAGIVAVEPAACPDPKGDMAPYTKMPIMVLFGDNVEVSPRWAPRLKLCRDFVQTANQAGGKAELIVLPSIGITGNSHMIMQDSNNIQIADLLGSWMDQRIGK